MRFFTKLFVGLLSGLLLLSTPARAQEAKKFLFGIGAGYATFEMNGLNDYIAGWYRGVLGMDMADIDGGLSVNAEFKFRPVENIPVSVLFGTGYMYDKTDGSGILRDDSLHTDINIIADITVSALPAMLTLAGTLEKNGFSLDAGGGIGYYSARVVTEAVDVSKPANVINYTWTGSQLGYHFLLRGDRHINDRIGLRLSYLYRFAKVDRLETVEGKRVIIENTDTPMKLDFTGYEISAGFLYYF